MSVSCFRTETVFGLAALDSQCDQLILVEDEADAMAIYQATGKMNVLALSRLKSMMLPQQVRRSRQLWLILITAFKLRLCILYVICL